jgi:glyoxylate/hydroxypyruvate reductase
VRQWVEARALLPKIRAVDDGTAFSEVAGIERERTRAPRLRLPAPARSGDVPMSRDKPILAVWTTWGTGGAWLEALTEAAPEFEVAGWPAVRETERVVAAAVWHPPAELFAACPNLAVVQSLGAGIDHLIKLGDRLPDLPILRLVDPVMTDRLAQFVLTGTLLFQRRFDLYWRQQGHEVWERHAHPDPADTRVGILGLGVIGTATAELLLKNGFRVSGWSRTAKQVSGLVCRHGPKGLAAIAAESDVLVCILPLTEATRGILSRPLFERMKPGSHLISAGRGEHLVAADLLAALDGGTLAGALLDVFPEEPLPQGDPFWAHPKVIVTPHTAAISNPTTGAVAIASGIRAVLNGERPANLAERGRSY